ncbi:hypothetical protein EDD16DRAFT_1517048 [Pisolithus croceorrhizus]|nr:hypothetical protein EDD16DRAFT_1517048 [Pisolithus croceorrhizus]KAI6128523.1 hypothetical protein EV401DRAFT_1885137 [Pisolithus croceorrhizus]
MSDQSSGFTDTPRQARIQVGPMEGTKNGTAGGFGWDKVGINRGDAGGDGDSVRQRRGSFPDFKHDERHTENIAKLDFVSHNHKAGLKREIFLQRMKRPCRSPLSNQRDGQHGDKYGVGSLSASVRRGKINYTLQPPEHCVFNEALEARCNPRRKLHEGIPAECYPELRQTGARRSRMVYVEVLAAATPRSKKLHAGRACSFVAQDNNPDGVTACRLRCCRMHQHTLCGVKIRNPLRGLHPG